MPQTRPATNDDLPQIIDLLDSIFRREKGVHDQSVLTDFPLLFSDDNLANCRVAERDGRIVSHAAVWPRRFRCSGKTIGVGIIVLVATEEESRRLGLAAALMRDLQTEMPQLGCQLGLLWTGVPDFYRSLGWQTVNTSGWIASGHRAAGTRELSVVDFHPERHLESLHQLHRSQPTHSQRTLLESSRLLTLPKCRVLVGELDGVAVSYLVEGRATNKRGLIEYAGDPSSIWQLVRSVTAENAPQRLLIYPTHPELAEMARVSDWTVAPLKSSKGFGDEMVLVLDEEVADPAILENLFCWGLEQA